MDVRVRSEVLLFFVCRETVACNFFPLLAVFVILQLHHGLLQLAQTLLICKMWCWSIFELRSNSKAEAGLDFGWWQWCGRSIRKLLLIRECFAQLLMVLSMLTALAWQTGDEHVSESHILCTAQCLQILRGDGWDKKQVGLNKELWLRQLYHKWGLDR